MLATLARHCVDEDAVRTPFVTNAQPLNDARTVTAWLTSEKMSTRASPSSSWQLGSGPGARAAREIRGSLEIRDSRAIDNGELRLDRQRSGGDQRAVATR